MADVAAAESVESASAPSEWDFDGNPAVIALFPELARRGTSLVVHRDDEMFNIFFYSHGRDTNRAIVLYLSSGGALWSAMRQVIEWRLGSLAGGCSISRADTAVSPATW
jgi:hypothetical protein